MNTVIDNRFRIGPDSYITLYSFIEKFDGHLHTRVSIDGQNFFLDDVWEILTESIPLYLRVFSDLAYKLEEIGVIETTDVEGVYNPSHNFDSFLSRINKMMVI